MWEGHLEEQGQEYIFGPVSVEGASRTHSQILSVLKSSRMLVAIQSPGPCPLGGIPDSSALGWDFIGLGLFRGRGGLW